MLTLEDRHKVIDRLDAAHIRDVAQQARMWLDENHTVELCYQPGDATWYSLTITEVERVLGGIGGGSLTPEERDVRSYIGLNEITNTGFGNDTYMVVYAQQGTAMWFKPGVDDPYWAAGKLIDNAASATAIGVLLEEIFGFSAD